MRSDCSLCSITCCSQALLTTRTLNRCLWMLAHPESCNCPSSTALFSSPDPLALTPTAPPLNSTAALPTSVLIVGNVRAAAGSEPSAALDRAAGTVLTGYLELGAI
mmetsp:Transcript_6525/g.13501  ORF Transcript_6525/g.13501 Transcript_6525/m.13501 type:complete len:106 (-) Transcript_6525:14-331(-)